MPLAPRVLETEWALPEGTVRVVDCMPANDYVPDLVRIVEGISGRVEMRSVMRLRFDYGRVRPVGATESYRHSGCCGSGRSVAANCRAAAWARLRDLRRLPGGGG